MRRLIAIFTVVMLYSLAYGQSGLNVAPFFDGNYASNPKVTMISMTGNQLGVQGMRVYKSISVTDDTELADKIGNAVAKDGVHAVAKDVSYKKGVLYYGFYSLGGEGISRRYLLYLNRRPTGKEKTTLIFIEGNLDVEAVKRMIK